MKNLVTIVCMSFFCLTIHAQKKKGNGEITKAELNNVTTMSEFVPGLKKGCKVNSAQFVYRIGNQQKTEQVTAKTEGVFLEQLKKAEVGGTIYMEVGRFNCNTDLTKSYKFLIIE